MKDKIRKGYTTGSCCAAGAAAALCFILADKRIEKWNMIGPTGLDISVPINMVEMRNTHHGRASVIKDGGDDPDVTTGAKVIVDVTLVKDSAKTLDDKMLEDESLENESLENEFLENESLENENLEVHAGYLEDKNDIHVGTVKPVGTIETTKNFRNYRNLKNGGNGGNSRNDGNGRNGGKSRGRGYILDPRVYLKTGTGIGIVTKPGLACPEGRGAINPVPRKMILKEVLKVCEMYGYEGNLLIEVSIPKGVELAEKTFNPKLGIVGGISVLGTTGVVEPMSSQAIIDTVRVELSVARALRDKAGPKDKTGLKDKASLKEKDRRKVVIITPGNYGLDFLEKAVFEKNGERKSFEGSEVNFDRQSLDFLKGIPDENVIKVSNFIGDSVVLAAENGFENIIVSGHLGKMIKVAGGMLNTHSKYGDNRVETAVKIIEEIEEQMLASASGLSMEQLLAQKKILLDKISEAVMVDEILRLVEEFGGEKLLNEFSRLVGEKVEKVLRNNLVKVSLKYDKMKINVIVFTNKFGLIYSDKIC